MCGELRLLPGQGTCRPRPPRGLRALAGAPGSAVATPLFMWLFVGLSLVLFVNLLIAMFNETYTSVQSQKSQEWKMQRCVLVEMFIKYPPFPAPLNILYLPVQLALRLASLARRWQRQRSSSVLPWSERRAKPAAGEGREDLTVRWTATAEGAERCLDRCEKGVRRRLE